MTPRIPLIVLLLAVGVLGNARADEPGFALHDGDRVVFYGDSITQAGGYCTMVEEYARSRFPKWDLRFYNAGVGGDTVQGGWAGKADLRVDRDVISLKPTVVTIMLGMNDGGYRALDKETLETFVHGYRTIVDKIRAALPGVRIYFIRTSPFDDVTRDPQFGKGYDDVLRTMDDSISKIAAEDHLEIVDFDKAVNDGLAAVWSQNRDLARQILPDRVHPNPAGHMVMGAALLRAWHAPALVTHVEIDAGAGQLTKAENATVTAISAPGAVFSWKETDMALPLPLGFDDSDTVLAQKAGADLESLDSETLVVSGLKPGSYDIKVDGGTVATADASQLASGLNLARYNTPMRRQAYQVRYGADDGSQFQKVRRQLFSAAARGEKGLEEGTVILATHDEVLQAARSSLVQPTEHTFSISPSAE
ncbi:MAG TPA: SGNH/GDSL hydrolase family protein [Opitutaceae bacterium]|jgi:lysophospholipase L1-like esterase|nr:SGNH/GDSL hydrolase family protein [Opitutaceae bacterium]